MDILRASQLPQQYNAVSILENNLAARADKVALLSPERELTFRQLSDEVNQLGNALRRLGVRFGEAVGMLTLLKPPEHAYVLQDCRARVLIAHRALVPALEPIRAQIAGLEHVIVIGGGAEGDLDYAALVAAESPELAA